MTQLSNENISVNLTFIVFIILIFTIIYNYLQSFMIIMNNLNQQQQHTSKQSQHLFNSFNYKQTYFNSNNILQNLNFLSKYSVQIS